MRFVLLIVFFLTEALAIFRLSDVSISRGNTTLQVETGGKLYVESNDDETLLGKIQITNDLTSMTALEMSKSGVNLDGTKSEIAIKGKVTISSRNTEAEAEKLTGFAYFTTYTQAQDKNFLVYSVDRTVSIGIDNDDLTLVFLNRNLNSNLKYAPQKSSRIYDYVTLPKSRLSIYWDEPAESYKNQNSDESTRNVIFSNPLPLAGSELFETVEPFQIFNNVWYSRSSGHIRFQVAPQWEDPDNSTTSNVTTTGMVMCLSSPENLIINMKSNPARSAIAGLATLFKVINPVQFRMSGFGIGIDYQNLTHNNWYGGWSPVSSDFFQIQSNFSFVGRFAVQFFQSDNGPLPSTTLGSSSTSLSTTLPTSTTGTPTTPPISTTTNSVPFYFNVSFFTILLAFWL